MADQRHALQAAGGLFGVLLAGPQVVSLAQPRGQALQARDLLALATLVQSTPSFRAAETFSPICLPAYNAAAFLHAYVHYVHQARF